MRASSKRLIQNERRASKPEPMSNRVLAIIVCHNPDLGALSATLTAVCAQLEEALVVDNDSSNQTEIESLLDRLNLAKNCYMSIAKRNENLGLGTAHNIGIEYAKRKGFDYVLLLDQDSVPQDSMVDNLLSASHRKTNKKLSAVGAVYLNSENGSESFFVRFGKLKFQRRYCTQADSDGCVEADFLISSGSLIALDALDDIGTMDETLFIDHVDTEWFLRAKSKGFRAYGVCNAVMNHALGEQTHRIQLGRSGRQRNVPQHKPFRYYYIFRNSVLLYRRGYCSALWKWNDLQRIGLMFVMFGLFKAPRRQNFKMMFKGLVDGVRGVSGKTKLDTN